MPRDPNSPIPGFEDEFTGTVGREKRIHKNQFHIHGLHLHNRELDTGYEWVEIRTGRWVRRPKSIKESA